MHLDKDLPLPKSSYSKDLAEHFNNFFISKIEKIGNGFSDAKTDRITHNTGDSKVLSNFRPCTTVEIKKIVSKTPSKSCSLDPIPTAFLKQCTDTLLLVIKDIINISIDQGTVPDLFEVAYVRPLLKKANLNLDDMKNHRPISNLSFISKLTEKVVFARLHEHIALNGLAEKMQCTYRQHHNIKTALTCVSNDILLPLDQGKAVVMVLLDLSTAFDTVDHATILSRLEHAFSIKGNALQWFRSYLNNIMQYTIISDASSPGIKLTCGVPQGSVLGPQLFSLYTVPLAAIAQKHGLKCHFYADDTQLYITLEPDTCFLNSILERIEKCIEEIAAWIRSNFLKLNGDKSEYLNFGSTKNLNKLNVRSVYIDQASVSRALQAWNLGVIFDSNFTLEAHMNKLCSNAFYQIRNISKVRAYPSRESTERLVHATVTSRLDMGNILLYGLLQKLVSKLQRVQNAAARLVTLTSRRAHITPILKELHWLPISQRIEYKILTTVYRTLHGHAPDYLKDMLRHYNPSRALRSKSCNNLEVPRARGAYGTRAFPICGPQLWNKLPCLLKNATTLKTFKKQPKTHLFQNVYN